MVCLLKKRTVHHAHGTAPLHRSESVRHMRGTTRCCTPMQQVAAPSVFVLVFSKATHAMALLLLLLHLLAPLATCRGADTGWQAAAAGPGPSCPARFAIKPGVAFR